MFSMLYILNLKDTHVSYSIVKADLEVLMNVHLQSNKQADNMHVILIGQKNKTQLTAQKKV